MSEYPDRKVHEALLNELCDLFDWSDRSALHALMHITNAVVNLRVDLDVERDRREEAEAHWRKAKKKMQEMKEDRDAWKGLANKWEQGARGSYAEVSDEGTEDVGG